MRISFQVVRARRSFSYKCPTCLKNRKKNITVEHTVNPFNKHPDGCAKNYEDVLRDVNKAADEQRRQFLLIPECSKCAS